METSSDPVVRTAPRSSRERILDPVNLTVFPSLVALLIARRAGVIAAEPLWKIWGALVLAHFAATGFAACYTPGTDRAKPRLFLTMSIALGGVLFYVTGWGAILSVAFVAHAVVVVQADGSRYGFTAIVVTLLTILVGELAIALGLVQSMISEPTGHGLAILEAAVTAIVIALVTRGQREKELAEARERESEERFRALVQYTSDAILVIEDTGGACIRAGVDCIEHGSLASDETIQMMVEHGTFLVPTSYLSEGLDVSRAAPELQAKAADVFPRARAMLGKAIAAGVKIACGTDAPAIPHGTNAKELWAMVDRGMTPMQALHAATVMSAELIDVDDRGRLVPGLLADIIAVPGDPSEDITMTEDVRFVMKGGRVYKGA
jgi:PAS domain-containing protein